MYICSICNKAFERKNQLNGHTAWHYPRKPITDDMRKTFSDNGRKNILKHNSTYWTEENRKMHSDLMKQKVASNPESYSVKNVSGRVKMIEYNGNVFKGNWEKIVAVYLDNHNIKWTNKLLPIKYFWEEKNSYHAYFPDFYLLDLDVYIEVKGYERERDRCKWKALANLIILKEIDIIKIQNDDFDINDKIAVINGVNNIL